MTRVLAQTHVGDHNRVLVRALDRRDGARHRPCFAPRSTPGVVLLRWNAEQKDGGDAECDRVVDVGRETVHRALRVAGHRGNRLLDVSPVADEQGMYELPRI